MPIRGIGKIRQAISWVEPRALILLYHRVADLASPDPFLLCVTPKHFAEHLQVLRKHGRLLQLGQLVQALRDGHLPRRAVAITFDDGYANNLYNAKPLLERYDIPATVFVTTGYIGQEREFWWDELERILLQPGTLPETLCLNDTGSAYQWELGDAAHYSEQEHGLYGRWNIGQDEPGLRQRLYRSLYEVLRSLPVRQQQALTAQLLRWAGAESVTRPTHRALSTDEVMDLAAGRLVEIGAHTVTHSDLFQLPVAEQRAEVNSSKNCLEEILGYAITSFAYPFGSRRNYTPETTSIVKDANFSSACSSFCGLVRRGADVFQLPRFPVRDCDGDAFASWLQECFRS